MNTYQTLSDKANKLDNQIAEMADERDLYDWLSETLPRCVLELEGAYIFCRSWFRYMHDWGSLPLDTIKWLEDHAMYSGPYRRSDGTMCVHFMSGDQEIILEFGVKAGGWYG